MTNVNNFNIGAHKMLRKLAIEFESAAKSLRELKKGIVRLEPSILDLIFEKITARYPEFTEVKEIDENGKQVTKLKSHPNAGKYIMDADTAANILSTLVTAYQKLDNQRLARFEKVFAEMRDNPEIFTVPEAEATAEPGNNEEKEREVAELITIKLAERIAEQERKRKENEQKTNRPNS